MIKTNIELVKYCYAQLGLPYWYGTYGQTASALLFKAKKLQYPLYYQATDFEKQYGKRVHDCIGLIKGYLWSDSLTDVPKYNASQDVSAPQMLAKCTEQGAIKNIPELLGVLVFFPGHIGVYIGNGYVIEARGHKYGVVKTKLKERPWTHWGKCPWILYEESQVQDTTGSGNIQKDIEKTKEIQMTFSVLKKGSVGKQVCTIQRLLRCLGHLGADGKVLNVDGDFGNNTVHAVKDFQTKNKYNNEKLIVDGEVGEKTWASLTGGKIK